MDKFVVRKQRGSEPPSASSSGGKVLKQATIESLKGTEYSENLTLNTTARVNVKKIEGEKCVVVVEDIRRHKAKLRLPGTPKNEMIESLQDLGKKIPPKHIMMETKIGRVVNKLRQHEDEDIRKAAKKVYIKWKSHFKDILDRPQIEVMCDTRSENLRSSGRRFLCDALGLEKGNKLPEVIERETFFHYKNLVNHQYRKTMRTLVFTLKHNEDIRKQVLSGEITVIDFIKQYKKQS